MFRRSHVVLIVVAVAVVRAPANAPPHMTPIPGTGSLGAASSDTFTFIVAGDNRPASASLPQPKTPKHIFDSAAAGHVAFVLWTGDMIVGFDSANGPLIATQYKEFFKLAKRAGAPVFAAPGNHEMDVKLKNGDTTIEVGSAAMQGYYRAAMQLSGSTPIYGTFTYANSRFILLNTEEIAPPSARRAVGTSPGSKVKLDPGYVSPAQLAWVRQVLDSNTSLHTFVLMHHPIQPRKPDKALDPASADSLVQLFASDSSISYVLASHEHLYYNAQTKDTASPPSRTDPSKAGAYYLVSGGAGAPLNGKPKDGGFHNYLAFTVRGATVNARLVRLP